MAETMPDGATALVAAAKKALYTTPHSRDQDMWSLPEIQAIRNASDDLRRECILVAVNEWGWEIGTYLLHYIARKRARLSVEDIETVLPPLYRLTDSPDYSVEHRMREVIGQVEATWVTLDQEGKARLRPRLARTAEVSKDRSIRMRLRKLTDAADEVPYDLIDEMDEVGRALRAVLAASPESAEVRTALIKLLAGFPASGKPGKKWLAEAATVAGQLDDPVGLARALLDAAIDAPDYEVHYPHGHRGIHYVCQGNEPLLCAVPVLAGLVARDDGGPAALELLPRLRVLALKAIMIIGQYAPPRSLRLANQCVQAIADAALPASITELLRVERGTRHGALLKQARKAVDSLAASQGLGRDELLERAVEDHGLSASGTRSVSLADGWTAVLEAGTRTARVGYLDPGSKSCKSLPPAVKTAGTEALAALQRELKALRATIGNERSRLDGLLAAGRNWDVGTWRELYLDHPVTGRLARAMIWVFDASELAGIPLDGTLLLTVDGREVSLPQRGQARLWHPVTADPGEVRAWRQLLLDREIAQPVKQAFREVYTLTPAEELTRDYSNRFAGHVFQQVQARALMKGRGWTPVPLAWWDDGIDHGVARREFESAGVAGQTRLRAEFFFDVASYDDMSGDMYAYVASDQVRFFSTATDNAVPLASVPALVFTEAMRDVDLFIGVTSIGANPEWLDRGEGRQFESYWHRYAFGDLSAGAEVRREVLERLVPRLAIADRCTLQSRFLEVRGDLRTYRIHLGSGNILMSPGDEYLCIVATRDTQAGKLFLPFDDDAVLSMILSKAFLLAADSKITDDTITRQIGRSLDAGQLNAGMTSDANSSAD